MIKNLLTAALALSLITNAVEMAICAAIDKAHRTLEGQMIELLEEQNNGLKSASEQVDRMVNLTTTANEEAQSCHDVVQFQHSLIEALTSTVYLPLPTEPVLLPAPMTSTSPRIVEATRTVPIGKAPLIYVGDTSTKRHKKIFGIFSKHSY